jgi:hypothetical protein
MMLTPRRLGLLLAGFCVLAAVVLLRHHDRAEAAEPGGWESTFQPTRIEWLALTLQAEVGAPTAHMAAELHFTVDTYLHGISVHVLGDGRASRAQLVKAAARGLFRIHLEAGEARLPPPPVSVDIARSPTAPSEVYRCSLGRGTEAPFPFEKFCTRSR